MIELRDLRCFVAVAEERHFARAARRLGIGQSPLSQAVARLEASLGVRLLERTSHEVVATAAGEAFLVAARETLAEAQRAVDAVNGAAPRGQVPVRIGATPITHFSVLPAVTAELARRSPELEVQVVELTQPALFSALAAHELDLGFAVEPPPQPRLTVELVRREPGVVVVGRRNRLARRRRLSLAEAAAGQPLAIWQRDIAPGLYDRVLASVAAAGVAATLVHHPGALADWAETFADEGFSLVPAGAPRAQEAVHVPLADAPSFDTFALWRAGDDRPLVEATLAASREGALARGWLVLG